VKVYSILNKLKMTVPTPFQYSWLPKDHFGQIETMMGLVLGFYLPLMARARSHDCFASFWTLGNNIFRWHTFFDNRVPAEFDTIYDWVDFLGLPVMTVY